MGKEGIFLNSCFDQGKRGTGVYLVAGREGGKKEEDFHVNVVPRRKRGGGEERKRASRLDRRRREEDLGKKKGDRPVLNKIPGGTAERGGMSEDRVVLGRVELGAGNRREEKEKKKKCGPSARSYCARQTERKGEGKLKLKRT